MLPEQFVHQVQQATDIVDLVSEYVAIKKKGRDYLGLCPFHQEKTPSFSVSPAKQIFYCFGCNAGGGVFQFVMQHQKVEFPEAVKFLAERASIPIPTDSAGLGETGSSRGELVKVSAFAAEFYRKQLRGSAGRVALEYARGRQLTDESIDKFGLGYSPDGWDGFYGPARAAGFSDRQLEAAGLVIPRREGNGFYDRFRHRLMFPIIDPAGRVIAFGGRALKADEQAKYINSPETPLFDKSSNLYGLSWARSTISQSEQVVVVEGYFDVVMCAQAGVTNVVATLGTALTERHVRMLSRYARDVVLVFDSDSAGAAAAQRALELFIVQQVNVRVAAVPTGKDPCDFVLAAGGDAMHQLIAEAPDALDYVWRRRSAEIGSGGSLVAQRQAAEEFLRLVATSSAYGAIDPVRQGLLVNRLSALLRIPPAQLAGQMRRLARRDTARGATPGAGPAVGNVSASEVARAQRDVLEVLLAAPELFDHAARHVGPEDFTDSSLAHLAAEIWRLAEEGDLSVEALLNVEADAAWGSAVTGMALEAQRRGNYEATLAGAVEYLELQHCRRELSNLRQAGDDESLRALGERLRRPDPRRRPTTG